MSACRYLFLVLLSVLSLSCAAASQAEIEWRVVNRFPLFSNPDDFARLAKAWPPEYSAEDFLANAVGSLNSQQARERLKQLLPINATLWDEGKGLYDRKRFFYNKHKIQLQVRLPGQFCHWTVAGQTFPRTPCNDWFDPVGLEIEEEREFSISVRTSGGGMLHLDGQKIATDLIIGLGDSFSSGEGNPDHPAEWNMNEPYSDIFSLSWIAQPRLRYMLNKEAKWWDLACHRSLLSWQSLYALSRAVKDRHRVVRFASFACSGAELYDGFFRAQIIPKERVEKAQVSRQEVIGVAPAAERDGGWGSDTQRRECHAAAESAFGTPAVAKPDCPLLRYSQLNALTLLLCDDVSPLKTVPEEERHVAYTAWNELYGPYDRLSCRGKLKEPTHVLLSFGGNDMAFARVVQWGIVPGTPSKGLLRPLKSVALNLGVRKFKQGVQDPEVAGRKVERHLSLLYSDLNRALTKHLGVQSSRIYAMTYPNLLPEEGKRDTACVNRFRGGNEALGQRIKATGFDGFLFGITTNDMYRIDKLFIRVLRNKQSDAFKDLSWNSIDSQLAFESVGRRMSLCGISAKCEDAIGHCVGIPKGSDCKAAKNECQADRYALALPKAKEGEESFPEALVYTNSSEWRPYDSARVRGVRTAWDAAMVQMRYPRSWVPESLDDDAYLREPDWDWNSGTVHPTAKSHSRIADRIDNAGGEGQRQVSDSRFKPDL